MRCRHTLYGSAFEMIKYLAAAALSLLVAAPAPAATVFDYHVYASGNAYISGGSYGALASGSFINANGPGGGNYSGWTSSSAALDSSASALSSQLAAMTVTGTVTHGQWTPGAVTLTGIDTGVNVFNIGAGGAPQWSSLYALTFAGSGTGAIVNVWGSSLSNFVNLNFGSLSADQVIFNFIEAESLTLNGMNVRGSVLAPGALVRIQGGSVEGSVVSDGFHSEGARIGGNGFAGMAPGAVPEPASWALLILGFAGIGAMIRRRSDPGPRVRFD